MKLVSKFSATAGTQFIADEVKPLSGYKIPTLISAIAERYEFSKTPTVEETTSTGAKFQNGRLIAKNINIAELGTFNDGLSVTTTDTDDSQAVLNDLYRFLKENFGLREPSTKPVHAFQSELIVDFDNNADHALKTFNPLIALLQKETEAINGLKKRAHFNRIDFSSDPSEPGPNLLFLIERRTGVPYDTNRYFCRAYLPTSAHIRTLKLLDEILGEKKS